MKEVTALRAAKHCVAFSQRALSIELYYSRATVVLARETRREVFYRTRVAPPAASSSFSVLAHEREADTEQGRTYSRSVRRPAGAIGEGAFRLRTRVAGGERRKSAQSLQEPIALIRLPKILWTAYKPHNRAHLSMYAEGGSSPCPITHPHPIASTYER